MCLWFYVTSSFSSVNTCFSLNNLPTEVAIHVITQFTVITLGAHAQRGYGSWVCLSVCLFLCYSTSHLWNVCLSHKRYGEGQKCLAVFSPCKDRAPPALYGYHTESPFFPCVKRACATTRCVSDHFRLRSRETSVV